MKIFERERMLREEGRAEGREEGREEGRAEERMRTEQALEEIRKLKEELARVKRM